MTESRAQPGSGFPGPRDATIYVECYVPESQIRNALDRAEEALGREGFLMLNATRCSRFDLDDWNDEEYPEGSDARVVVERVLIHGEVEFGPFIYGSSDA